MKKITEEVVGYPEGLKFLSFEIIGAGDLRVSESNQISCGGKKGFSFGVSWSHYPYAGGIISNEDAIELAKCILIQNGLWKT